MGKENDGGKLEGRQIESERRRIYITERIVNVQTALVDADDAWISELIFI